MIQRKQTLFLLFSIIALILTAIFPLADFYAKTPEAYSYILKVFSFKPMSDAIASPYTIGFNISLIIIWIITLLLNTITIFLYKNRKLQMKLVSITIALLFAFIAVIFFYYSPVIEKKLSVATEYVKCIGIYLPIVSFLFLVLAFRGINKDEKLVQSIDRLR